MAEPGIDASRAALTPVSRADGADVVLLPTDLSVATGVPSLTNCIEGTPVRTLARTLAMLA